MLQIPEIGDQPDLSVEPAPSIIEPSSGVLSFETAPNKPTDLELANLFPDEPATDDADVAEATDPANSEVGPAEQLTLEQTSKSSTSLRNADYPNTYISLIEVDLTSPNHWVKLTWSGPDADSQETGPFHSSPGRGLGYNDCDDVDESNRQNSNCTPKGTMHVQGFSEDMATCPHCKFVTWFNIRREVAFHYYPDVPNYPASHGCVRLENMRNAQLIHNNSKIGATEVKVAGKWTFRQ